MSAYGCVGTLYNNNLAYHTGHVFNTGMVNVVELCVVSSLHSYHLIDLPAKIDIDLYTFGKLAHCQATKPSCTLLSMVAMLLL